MEKISRNVQKREKFVFLKKIGENAGISKNHPKFIVIYKHFAKVLAAVNTNTCVLRTKDNRRFEDLHSFGDEISVHELRFVTI